MVLVESPRLHADMTFKGDSGKAKLRVPRLALAP